MPHIALPEGLHGIRSAMAYRPETAKPLNEIVDVLLHQPNSLTPGERELIATYVSYLNDCYYCQTIHGAIAASSVVQSYCTLAVGPWSIMPHSTARFPPVTAGLLIR